MRISIKAILVGLACAVATGSVSEARPLKKRAALPNPCEGNFELKVAVQAAQGSEVDPVGYTLKFDNKSGKGLVARIHTGDSRAIDRKQCEGWRKRNWELLDRMAYENKQPQRKGVVCYNVATITYKLGSKRERVDLCLGDASADTLAYAFQEFYESGDFLVAR